MIVFLSETILIDLSKDSYHLLNLSRNINQNFVDISEKLS